MHARLCPSYAHARTPTPPLPWHSFGAELPWPLPAALVSAGALPLLHPAAAATVAAWLYAFTAPWFALKQFISLLHLARAAQRVVELDTADVAARAPAKKTAAATATAAAAPGSGKKRAASRARK